MRRSTCILSIIMVVSLASLSYAALDDGIVGYWPLEGSAKDGSGYGNNGVVIGNPRNVAGKVGMALDFDGDDAIEIASVPVLEIDDTLTAACWIFPRAILDAAGNDHAGIFWKGNMIGWGSDAYNWRIATASDMGLTWGSTGGGVEGYFATANCFVNGLDTWYHVALVENGSEGRAYVNGVELADADVTGGDMHRPAAPFDTWPSEPIRIGYSQGRDGDLAKLVFFDGIIDEAILYDRALSANEVNDLMNSGLPTTAVEPGDKLTTTWSSIKAD